MKPKIHSVAVIVALAFACSGLAQEKKEDKKEAVDKATARDLELLQGEWRAYAVWWGGGLSVESSAIEGGPITIKGRTFTKKVFGGDKGKVELVDQVATIERIDATKTPKEIDLKVRSNESDVKPRSKESDPKVESKDGNEKTVKLVYTVDEKAFEFFWVDDGAERPKNPWYFGQTGRPFPLKIDDKGKLYQYRRSK